jgi:hypothetical protein
MMSFLGLEAGTKVIEKDKGERERHRIGVKALRMDSVS